MVLVAIQDQIHSGFKGLWSASSPRFFPMASCCSVCLQSLPLCSSVWETSPICTKAQSATLGSVPTQAFIKPIWIVMKTPFFRSQSSSFSFLMPKLTYPQSISVIKPNYLGPGGHLCIWGSVRSRVYTFTRRCFCTGCWETTHPVPFPWPPTLVSLLPATAWHMRLNWLNRSKPSNRAHDLSPGLNSIFWSQDSGSRRLQNLVICTILPCLCISSLTPSLLALQFSLSLLKELLSMESLDTISTFMEVLSTH